MYGSVIDSSCSLPMTVLPLNKKPLTMALRAGCRLDSGLGDADRSSMDCAHVGGDAGAVTSWAGAGCSTVDGLTGSTLGLAGNSSTDFASESVAGSSWPYPVMGKQQTSMNANSPAGLDRR
jgi:hypothetical protein